MAAMVTNFMGATQSRMEMIQARNRELFEQQKRTAQRGPTPEIFFTKPIDNSRIVKADDPERKREMRSFSIVSTLLFVLVMVYVWQHFSAIEMGYQIETQKAQVEQLREQNRQIRLTEAQLTEPQRIDVIARQLGLSVPQPGQVIRTDAMTGQEGAVEASVAAPARTVE